VVNLSLNVSHKKKACLGIKRGYQISLLHYTLDFFSRMASQASLQEKILFFASNHRGAAFSPNLTKDNRLWTFTLFSDLAGNQ
jgi:hypothetical protein